MKHGLVAVVCLALLLVSVPCFAIDVVVFGPQRYTRTTGAPNVFRATFPGRVVDGTLIVANGDEPAGDRISSVVITLNGEPVLDTSAFNQNVGRLVRSVTLRDSNVIAVELRSKPGSHVAVTILAHLDVEAGGVVGRGGGIVRVTEAQSPLCGTTITVLPDSLPIDALLTVTTAALPAPLPDGVIQVDEAMALNSTTPLARPVIVEIPFPVQLPGDIRMLYRYDEPIHRWSMVDALPGPDSQTLRALLPHFSVYLRARMRLNTASLDSGFSVHADAFPFANDTVSCSAAPGGMCEGMAVVAAKYFTSFAADTGECLTDLRQFGKSNSCSRRSYGDGCRVVTRRSIVLDGSR